jgi:hypothetical protein
MVTGKEAIYIKEYPLGSMKVSVIVNSKKEVHIWFLVMVRMVFINGLGDFW